MEIKTELIAAKMAERIGQLEQQSITFEVLANQLLEVVAEKDARIAELEAQSGAEAN